MQNVKSSNNFVNIFPKVRQAKDRLCLIENEFDQIEVERLPEDIFKTLADKLTYHWYRVAHFLLLNQTELDHLEADFSTTYERTFQMLKKWAKANPDKIWGELKYILAQVGRMDLVMECEKKLIPRYATFGVQRPSVAFFGREKELIKMHDCLMKLQKSGKLFLVLTGMSGIGKTQLARKYASVYHKYYDNIVWLNSAYGKIRASMINLCNQLGLLIVDSKGDTFSIETITAKIHNYYRIGNTLYIFDNVDDESVKKFETFVSKIPSSFTMVTSQCRGWTHNALKMDVESFSPEEGINFMKQNIKTNNEEKLKEIAVELSYFPLSIHQAVIYINNMHVSPQEYLKLYQSNPIAVLDEFLECEAEIKSGVAAINMVLHKLHMNGEILTLNVLNCLSYCDGKSITQEFLKQICTHWEEIDDTQKNHVIIVMMNYSLISREENDKSSERHTFSIHDITQLACQTYQKQTKMFPKHLNVLIAFIKQQLSLQKHHNQFGYHWYKHLIYLFMKNEEMMCEEFSDFSSEICALLETKGLFHEAVTIMKQMEKRQSEILRSTQPSTLTIMNNKALCLDQMGKCKDDVFSEIEKVETGILVINHPSTLTIKNNRALCTMNIGKYNEAFKIYSEIEETLNEVLESNHPSLLIIQNNKALCLLEMGKYEQAIKIYSKVEKTQTEILGSSHPLTLTTINNKASCVMELGKYYEAIEIYSKVEKIQTEVLGSNHPSTLEIKNNRAICLDKIGKYDEAIEIYSEIEKVKTENLGSKHPSTLLTKNNKALCTMNMGKYDEAIKIYSEVEKVQTEFLGSNHPDTLTTKMNTAGCIMGMGKYDEAIEIYSEVDKIEAEDLGNNHPSTLATRNARGLCVMKMGKYDESIEIFSEVEKMRAEVLGSNHPSTLVTKNNKALCLTEKGDYDEALTIYTEVEKIQIEILGNIHPLVLTTKNNRAVCLEKIGRYHEAVEIYSDLEKIQTQILGSNHPSILTIKNNRAVCMDQMGKYDEAIGIYSEVEIILTEVLGSKHPLTLVIKNNKVACMDKRGKYYKGFYSEVEKV